MGEKHCLTCTCHSPQKGPARVRVKTSPDGDWEEWGVKLNGLGSTTIYKKWSRGRMWVYEDGTIDSTHATELHPDDFAVLWPAYKANEEARRDRVRAQNERRKAQRPKASE